MEEVASKKRKPSTKNGFNSTLQNMCIKKMLMQKYLNDWIKQIFVNGLLKDKGRDYVLGKRNTKLKFWHLSV